jgi:putative transposase
VADGASFDKACQAIGLSERTLQRWKHSAEDRRHGPRKKPANALTPAERARIVATATSVEFRDQSPKQIVPRLADRGVYIASESTFYRVLHAEGLQHHRGRASPPTPREREHVATRPWQVASWDITYLRTFVRGRFFYLYLLEDVWSRKILGWAVHDSESSAKAAAMVERVREAAATDGVDLAGWVLHSDNGIPMKGATMLATMQRLGIVPSFSRPAVSDDNPFSESLFRTLKYMPHYPRSGFAAIADARAWVAQFVDWYNNRHLHSGIGFVAPADRHAGRDVEILARRRSTYERARRRHPRRWARTCRAWDRPLVVRLNPAHASSLENAA